MDGLYPLEDKEASEKEKNIGLKEKFLYFRGSLPLNIIGFSNHRCNALLR